MKVSGSGAAVGAVVGCVARAAVVILNVMGHGGEGVPAAFILPSAVIGLLVGAVAGAVGKPLLGATVGAVLSGVIFELFMCSCASLIGSFSREASDRFLSHTLIYGLEMALAGAVAGGVGGLVGQIADREVPLEPVALPPLGEGEGRQQPRSVPEKPPAQGSDVSEGIRKKEGYE